uniref:Mu/omega-theraphotoxin-Tap2a n=1 Tax=Theraphosa apophysis TaxID=1956358 RepID=TAP2A_THEAO|nr:RecName: Full=Mu/omega-theraphotoxin-Tap2a; Short=Mu/omega-TRTX-Tap2a [Theraphosa apophysis]
DCLGFMKPCDINNDKCCSSYVCGRNNHWCKFHL